MTTAPSAWATATTLTHGGRPTGAAVTVNPVVARTSTVVFDSMATLQASLDAHQAGQRPLLYGRKGTSTSHALEDVVARLEGAHACKLFGSGLAAIACTFLAFTRPGDHVLVIDTCYEPVRKLCAHYLAQRSVQVDYFSPNLSDLAHKIRPETRLIWVETPGSLVYEMCDLPALVRIARAHENEAGSIRVAVDNTWGSAMLYHPLALGADVSVIAGTKYLVGHSDAMLGCVSTSESAWPTLHGTVELLGHSISADDAYLALRGMRTLAVRLAHQAGSSLEIAKWLQQQALVYRVHTPMLPDDPGHALWKRDFVGGNGLLSIEFYAGVGMVDACAFCDALQIFGLGHSWGGYESLALPVHVAGARSLSRWEERGAVVRLHIGLEDTQDLQQDLLLGLSALADRLGQARPDS
ncbi:cystathionine beta-lyase [Hydrogenophaga sp. OTU3427]|uniref:cystathionine beta-lyase n=1 Tax=Hydrogenophaga sp. OTU3427 TaxID=3043856 RepID=UPI00313BE410